MISSVCMVVHSYCPDDPRIRREAEALASGGTQVDVICLRNDGEERDERVNGVRYIRLPVQRKRGGIVRYLFEYGAFSLLAFFTASWLALKQKYDIFQAHNMPDTLVFCGLIHRLRGARIILDLHDLVPEVYIAKYELSRDSWVIKFLCGVEAFCVASVDLAITTSIAFREAMIERGIDPEKIRIILNSPDETIFPELSEPDAISNNGTLRLIYHGTLVHRSGLDLALRAVARLREQIPGITLEVCGSGDAAEDCRRLSRELNIEEAVHFNGHRPIEEIPDYVRKSDLGLVPNRKNPFTEKNLPTRIFEYLRMRKPVIVARTPGVEDYFGSDDLLYFTPGSEEDLARAIRQAYENPDETRAVLNRGVSIYDRHRWEHERKRFVSVLTSLVAGEPLPSTD